MAAAAGRSGSVEEEVDSFGEREVEVAAILADLPSIVLARCCCGEGQPRRREKQLQPEIPSWGRRRLRTVPVGKPVGVSAAAADRGEGAASPDTPLAFPEDDREEEDEEAAAAAKKKARAHEEWVQQQQRGVVASLSHENTHLLKQIEEFKARLQTSRSTNDSLKQMQSKHKKRQRPQEEEEEQGRKLQARAAANRPALVLDLNEPAEPEPEPEPVAAQWCHRGQQQPAMMQHKAALTAAARRRRQEIRRAKAAASRTRRLLG